MIDVGTGTDSYYSLPPPPTASILSVQEEEPRTVMVTASVVEVIMVELCTTPLISKPPVLQPKVST